MSPKSLTRAVCNLPTFKPSNLQAFQPCNLATFVHERLTEYLRFIVPEEESVLLLGVEQGGLLAALKPSRGVGVGCSEQVVGQARERHPQYQYLFAPDYALNLDETFEYIVLHGVTPGVHDVFALLRRIRRLCTPTSRIVVVHPNRLWRPVLRRTSWGLRKAPAVDQNRLRVADLRVMLHGAGFETIDVRSKLPCPFRLFGLGAMINWLAGWIPFVHLLASMDILVARPIEHGDPAEKSATIVLTTRDERDNIEPIVRAIPDVGRETEILFVEGHSVDGTQAEIERVIRAYPAKKIRLLTQDGVGQGDAIHKGFCEAKGDVVILLEADQTSPPEDVLKAFEIIASGRAEYVNGSRFVYARGQNAMPWRKAIGNKLFAAWFTWFLGRRVTDVLCGLKAIDRRQFARLNRQWGFLGLFDPFGDFELLLGAARLGLSICEVPTRYAARIYGETKSRFLTHGMMLVHMALRATAVFKCR